MIDAARFITGEMTDEAERHLTIRRARSIIKTAIKNPNELTADDINNIQNANAVMAYYAVFEAGIGKP